MIGFGVIGYGYWGPNLVRNLAELPDAQVTRVVDLRPQRLELAKKRHPGIEISTEIDSVFNDPKVDAIAIATPVSTHFALALRALQAGKHVLVEKPICDNSDDVKRLIDEADARGLILLVDHTFPYTGAVRKIKELIDSGAVGDLYYYDSVRINLGLFQTDTSVIWDLAVHDLSIVDFLLNRQPDEVACTGSSHLAGHPEDIAYLTLYYPNNLIGHIHVNWLSPVKLRRTLVSGARKMIVYDDLESAEKVRVHDKGLLLGDNDEQLNQTRLRGYRSGDIWSPQVDVSEALRTEALHFVECIEGKASPITGGASGLRVVQVLEAASESLKKRGAPVRLS